MEEEKALLLEIDELHSKLLQEPFGHWNGVHKLKPSGYNYSRNAKLMLEKILMLVSKFNPNYITSHDISAYSHTCDKEVSYVDYHDKEASKKNAAKKRNTEFIDSIHEANRQINLDLFSLFLKIKEIKNE